MFENKDYSFLSKILHHLVLGNNFIPEMLHDIEVAFFKKKIKLDNLKKHLFVCGLPRSGTTILMRTLYETKQFASLTYRDMPFVVSPNIWSKISNKVKTKAEKQRIHGDNISINIDSPEALEEVFWRVKLHKNYIFSNRLIDHVADEFTINEFRNFISLILYKYKKNFYLSKNNNNILRLESIIKAFPNCLILIPFRDPIQQAHSLLTQHKNFKKIQYENKFVKNYMKYLAHYEFGCIHRPFEFAQNKKISINNNSIEYWLMQWINTYEHLVQEKFTKKDNIIYLNYEYFCDEPKKVLKRLFKKIGLDSSSFENELKLEKKSKKIHIDDDSIISKSQNIFDKLKELNNRSFN